MYFVREKKRVASPSGGTELWLVDKTHHNIKLIFTWERGMPVLAHRSTLTRTWAEFTLKRDEPRPARLLPFFPSSSSHFVMSIVRAQGALRLVGLGTPMSLWRHVEIARLPALPAPAAFPLGRFAGLGLSAGQASSLARPHAEPLSPTPNRRNIQHARAYRNSPTRPADLAVTDIPTWPGAQTRCDTIYAKRENRTA